MTYSYKNGNEKLFIQKAKNFSLPEYLLVLKDTCACSLLSYLAKPPLHVLSFFQTADLLIKILSKEKLLTSGFSSTLATM